VGLSAVDLLVCFTGGAKARLNFFNEPEDKSFLFFACAFAKGTFKALFGLPAVIIGNAFGLHNLFLSNYNLNILRLPRRHASIELPASSKHFAETCRLTPNWCGIHRNDGENIEHRIPTVTFTM
jgi:hypothetical protein